MFQRKLGLLAGIALASCVWTPLTALAADSNIVFVQNPGAGLTPQQLEEEKRKREQQHGQDQQKRGQEQQPRGQEQQRAQQPQQQQRAQEQQQQRTQEQQRAQQIQQQQQQRVQEQQREKALIQQKQAQEQQKSQQLQQEKAQEAQREKALIQQKQAQEQQKAQQLQQQKTQEGQREKALDQHKQTQEQKTQQPQQQKTQEGQREKALDQQKQTQEQKTQQPQQQKGQEAEREKALDQQKRAQDNQRPGKPGDSTTGSHGEAVKPGGAIQGATQQGAPGTQPLKPGVAVQNAPVQGDPGTQQAKPGQLGQPGKFTNQPPQQAAPAQVSEEFKRGQAEREANRAHVQQLVEKQNQLAARERGQAQINERLRLENEHLRTIREERKPPVIDRSGQTVIQEGNRTIYKINNQVYIQHNETERFKLFGGGDFRTSRGRDGNTISTLIRPDGGRVEVEVDSYGRPLRRVRFLPNGERIVLFENRPIAAGLGFAFGSFIVDLPAPRIDIPREQYIVDTESASEDDIYGALDAGPVEPIDRGYSLDEIRASVRLRERMRSVNIDTINFDFGSWQIGPDQAAVLESVAAVIRDITYRNPREVFLIEGHTDAVGSDIDNLSLSDRRAEAVADVLAKQFQVPAENLVTQGYGKQFLLIQTDGPERRNRRVTIRRITPLLSGGEREQRMGERDDPDGRHRR